MEDACNGEIMKEMLFPEDELYALRERVKRKNPIYTTRVSDEVGKYFVGNLVRTNISPTVLIVREIITLDSLGEHPWLNELTRAQKEEIAQYDPPYELIKLERVI